ncbi:major facilitator superfamily transporter [Colletotrichum salicis]|uniref:Major facilitator superfamily transporter n=1 Tax=Colletotrichum salicis TaxID=1209931 RepID=A0A135U8M6_9PEZI|nr:major facilitator superfamily transporter [Colletotrichum salicis]
MSNDKPTVENIDDINAKMAQRSSYDAKLDPEKHTEQAMAYDPTVERKLRLKIDLMIVPTVALLYLFCFIDRANIGNARIAGLEKDLGMAGYDYNGTLSVFYVSYILFEIPANILCKVMGPGWFLPLTTLLFGICSVGTAFVHTVPQLMAVRFLLGIFEAGMLPGIAYYLSRWYRRSELAFRLSLYIVMAPLAGAFGGLLASAILRLDSFGSVHTWRMIFAIEGIITIGLALIGFITLTDRPASARWLTEAEKDLAETRVRSERVGQTQVLDKMDTKKLRRGIFAPVTLATSFVFLLNNVTVQGLAFFLPTIVRGIYPTATVQRQQLFTVPPYVVGAFFTVLLPLLSWRLDRRQIFFMMSAPLAMVGYIMFLASKDLSVRYGATFLITSAVFALGALTNAQVAANVVSDTARSAAIGTNVMFGNVGGLISTWAFLPWDAPNYPIGNGLNLATCSMILITSTLTLFWMKRDNRRRAARNVEAELQGLSRQEERGDQLRRLAEIQQLENQHGRNARAEAIATILLSESGLHPIEQVKLHHMLAGSPRDYLYHVRQCLIKVDEIIRICNEDGVSSADWPQQCALVAHTDFQSQGSSIGPPPSSDLAGKDDTVSVAPSLVDSQATTWSPSAPPVPEGQKTGQDVPASSEGMSKRASANLQLQGSPSDEFLQFYQEVLEEYPELV